MTSCSYFSLFCLLALVAVLNNVAVVVDAFAPSGGRAFVAASYRQQRRGLNMFSGDKEGAVKPLETVAAESDDSDSLDAVEAVSSGGENSSQQQGMTVKDMNTGELKEVKWVDPAMAANTK